MVVRAVPVHVLATRAMGAAIFSNAHHHPDGRTAHPDVGSRSFLCLERSHGRDGGIRTRGLLLPNQLHPVGRRSLASPDMGLNCGNAGWVSPHVAW